jgi:hypothetical protein
MNQKLIISEIRKRKVLFGIIFFSFIALTSFFNGTHLTLPKFFLTYKLYFAIPFFILNMIIVPLLVSTTIILLLEKIKQIKQLSNKKTFLGITGTFFGILGGACPGCFVGIFPAIFGIFGITANLTILPLKGIELLILSAILLTISIFYLSKEISCKNKNKFAKTNLRFLNFNSF